MHRFCREVEETNPESPVVAKGTESSSVSGNPAVPTSVKVGGWRMTQGLVVENEREYFVGRQKLCYLLWTWSCRCRCHMY